MKETHHDLSHNLYYADQFGSAEDQVKWLDSMNIADPCIVVRYPSHCEELHFTSRVVKGNIIYSQYCVFRPSLNLRIRTFKSDKVLDLRYYLFSRGFDAIYSMTYFKPSKLCEEEDLAAVDTAVAEDAASLSRTEVLECGS